MPSGRTVQRVRARTTFPGWPNYLGTLQGGLRELDRTVKANCPICIVVQDSHYKEIRIELQRIIIETMSDVGRIVEARYDYPIRNPRRTSPGATDSSGRKTPCLETLLVFS